MVHVQRSGVGSKASRQGWSTRKMRDCFVSHTLFPQVVWTHDIFHENRTPMWHISEPLDTQGAALLEDTTGHEPSVAAGCPHPAWQNSGKISSPTLRALTGGVSAMTVSGLALRVGYMETEKWDICDPFSCLIELGSNFSFQSLAWILVHLFLPLLFNLKGLSSICLIPFHIIYLSVVYKSAGYLF